MGRKLPIKALVAQALSQPVPLSRCDEAFLMSVHSFVMLSEAKDLSKFLRPAWCFV